MSAATDGFSAMMSFLAMGGERPQMISAKQRAVQPPAALTHTRVLATRAHARAGTLVRQPRLRGAEKVLGEKLACRRLLIPQHHEDDELQLIERERRARCGEGSLEHELARLRGEYPRLLQRDQEAAALRIELGEFARREGTETRAAIRQWSARCPSSAHHSGEPMQRLADVGVFESSGRELAGNSLAIIGE